jgi:hypothetical protein
MSPRAKEALRKCLNLRKYPLPQSVLAEQRILKQLNVTDFAAVVEALSQGQQGPQGSVSNG